MIESAHITFETPFSGQHVLDTQSQPLYQQELSHWISSLQNDEALPILDSSCGPGLEVKYLRNKGIPVIGADLSLDMLRSAPIRRKVLTRNYQLPFIKEAFAGVLSKDTWVFLSSLAREAFLSECFRVLKPDGQLLLSSQHQSRTVIHARARKNSLPAIFTLKDESQSREVLENLEEDHHIDCVEYETNFHQTKELIIQSGLTIEYASEYPSDSAFAQENPWFTYQGFIFNAKKPR